MADANVAYQVILVITAGVLAARAGQKLKIPEAIPLLVTGYILGADILGLLDLGVFGVGLGFASLVAVPIILYYDGLRLDSRHLLDIWTTVFSINTVAVVVTMAGIAVFGHLVMGLSMHSALLLGVILASTDPAGILPVLRKLNIRKKVATVLEAETALNDAMAIALFLIILGVASGEQVSAQSSVAQFLYFIFASTIVGCIVGVVVNEALRAMRIAKDATFASFVVILAAYGISEAIGASGVISVVVAAFVFRFFIQSRFVDPLSRLNVAHVWENLNFMAVALVFLVLGSQLQLSTVLPYAITGIVIALAFMFIVRPVTILASMFFDTSFSLREKLLIAWLGGPRGTVSAALASIILSRAYAGGFNLAEANAIFAVTLVVIVVTVVLTNVTASFAVHKLLGVRQDDLEEKYRMLSTELKAMAVASRKLREEWKEGLIRDRLYEEISVQHRRKMTDIDSQLMALLRTAPQLEMKFRSRKVQEVIYSQIAALEAAYENKELAEDDYSELTRKFLEQIERLEEIESTPSSPAGASISLQDIDMVGEEPAPDGLLAAAPAAKTVPPKPVLPKSARRPAG